MTDFRRVRALYGETQEQFGRRLGWSGPRAHIERKVRRYESGETPIVGTMAVLLRLVEETYRKPDTGNRRKLTATKGKEGK
jgi:transcriptional regulator with XRE-family HTH domain